MRTLVPYTAIALGVVLLVASGGSITPGALRLLTLGGAVALITVAAVSWALKGDTASRTIAKCGVSGAVFSGMLFILLLGGLWIGGRSGEAEAIVFSQPVPMSVGVLIVALGTALVCALLGSLGYGVGRVVLRKRAAGSVA